MSTYIEVEFKDISFNCVPSGAAGNPYTGDLPPIDITLKTKPGTDVPGLNDLNLRLLF